MSITIPVVFLLLVLVLIGITTGKQRVTWIVVAVLFGFYLAGTKNAAEIHNFLNSITHSFAK